MMLTKKQKVVLTTCIISATVLVVIIVVVIIIVALTKDKKTTSSSNQHATMRIMFDNNSVSMPGRIAEMPINGQRTTPVYLGLKVIELLWSINS
jgi:cell division protein FtsN